MVQTLSKTAEKQILLAIDSVVDNVGQGMHPTDAVIKVAKEQRLSRNYADLVCTGYNTGATNFQREKHSTVLEKFADFPIADPVKIAQALWPSKILPPSEEKTASIVSDEYSNAPLPNYHSQKVAMEKVAAVDLGKWTDKPTTVVKKALPSEALVKRAKLMKEADQLRQVAVDQQEELLVALGRFSDAVKQASDATLHKLHYDAQAVHGDVGASVVKYALTRNKRAFKPPDKPPIASITDWDSGPHGLLQQCVKTAELVHTTKADYVEYKEASAKEIDEMMLPFGLPPTSPSVGEKTAIGFWGGMATQSLRDALPKPKPAGEVAEGKVTGLAADLSDPSHENEIRKIQAQAMLHDLLTNDDVVSGYEPDEVLQAYNEMSQLSPHSATQPVLVRPWLRKRLTQGALEPFEAAEMANVEKTIGEMRYPIHKQSNNSILGTNHVILR